MMLFSPETEQQNHIIAGWLGARLGVTFAPPYLALASLDHRGEIIGAIVLNNFDGTNIDLTGAGEGGFMPSIVRGVARYIFDQLGCARVTLRTRKSNKQTRRLLNRHFKFEVVLKSWFGNEDAYQFRMCRDECPWLEKNNGFDAVAAAAA